MRKAGTVAAIIVLILLGLSNSALIASALNSVANKLLLYVHVARLYTREPDSTLVMPISTISKKDIADTWQSPRGSSRKHEGQDILAPRGTPVLSVTNGYVMNVGENTLGGLTVSVVGDGGRVYYYAHLDSYAPALSEGDYVTEQTLLGYVGTTGNALGTPPHLHFGVYTASGAINPLPLLTNRGMNRPVERTSRLQEGLITPKPKARRTR